MISTLTTTNWQVGFPCKARKNDTVMRGTMAEEIPADWYPDAQGTIRWWDGQQWTDHVRDSAPETGAQTSVMSTSVGKTYSTSTSTSASSVLSTDDLEDAEHAATRRIWLTATAVGLAAFFLGLGVGGRGEPANPSSSPTTAATSSPQLEQLQQQLDDRQQQLDAREQQLSEREQALADASATPSPTPTPTPTHTLSPSTTRTSVGDGTWRVGHDVEAGSYSSDGPRDTSIECEYTVSSDSAGLDVIDEDQTYDPATVDLNDGDYFTTENCETWTQD